MLHNFITDDRFSSFHLPIYQSINPSISSAINLSNYLYIYMYLQVYLSINTFKYFSTLSLTVYQHIYLSIYLSTHLSNNLISIYLSTYLTMNNLLLYPHISLQHEDDRCLCSSQHPDLLTSGPQTVEGKYFDDLIDISITHVHSVRYFYHTCLF